MQTELVDDDGMQQPDQIGARAHHVARIGERLFERARAAEPVTAFEHEHRETGAAEVRGRGEAVVPTAHDHHVPGPAGEVA